MSKPAVDLELKKAFSELHIKMVESSKKIRVIDAQIQAYNRFLLRLQVSKREIDNLPSDVKTYESVGRMFLLFKDLDEVKENFKNKEETIKARIEELESSKIYLTKNLKESEDNLREMVQQRKGQP